MFKHIIQTLTF